MVLHAKIQELWHRRGHLNDTQRDFISNLVQERKPKNCLEIGFATGRSCITVYFSCFPSKMLSIDLNLDYMNAREHASIILKNCPNLSILESDSSKLNFQEIKHKYFDGNELDFSFIDGNHSYEGCMLDLENVKSISKVGSLVVVDDFRSCRPKGFRFPEVDRAVNDFVMKYNLKLDIWHNSGKGLAVIFV